MTYKSIVAIGASSMVWSVLIRSSSRSEASLEGPHFADAHTLSVALDLAGAGAGLAARTARWTSII